MNENATMGKLVGVALTITVAIIVIASVMMPVLSDAQKNAGEEVTYTNGNIYGYHLGESTDSAILTFNYTDGWKYNGETAEGGFVVVTESVTVQVYGDVGARAVITEPTGSTDLRTEWRSYDTSLNFENGIITIERGGPNPTTTTYTYDWILLPSENGEWQTRSGLYTAYVNTISDIMAVGYYSTGENDTAYCFRNGKLSVEEDYTTDATYTINAVPGTTDVYTVSNLSLIVGEESFNPWFVLMKTTIVGHEANGAAYSLYGAIPAVVLVALLSAAVALVRSKIE